MLQNLLVSTISLISVFFHQQLMAFTVVMSTDQPQKIPPEMTETTVPETVTKAVMEDIASKNQIALAELKISQAEKQLWSNGCLGLAEERELCTQAMVPGWRVLVTGNEQTWIYRTDETGRIFRQEK